jgi:hypothetical protein
LRAKGAISVSTRRRAHSSRVSGVRLTRRDLLAATLGGAAALTVRRPFDMPAVLAASSAPIKLGVLLPYSKVYQQLGEDITSGMVLYRRPLDHAHP